MASLVAEAKAQRHSRRVGQRFGTLEAIRKAVQLTRKMEKPQADFDELRNLAITALALPDLRPSAEWITEPDEKGWNNHNWAIDPQFRHHAVGGWNRKVSVRKVGKTREDAQEIIRLPAPGDDEAVGWSPDGRFLAVWCWPPKG